MMTQPVSGNQVADTMPDDTSSFPSTGKDTAGYSVSYKMGKAGQGLM